MVAHTRILIAELGEAVAERPGSGAEAVARALRDAGMEIVYVGSNQTPEQIVRTVVQEDADAIGLSVLSGDHLMPYRRTIELLAENDASDVVLFGGGTIPEVDVSELERLGVAKVFAGGASVDDIVNWVRNHVGVEVQA